MLLFVIAGAVYHWEYNLYVSSIIPAVSVSPPKAEAEEESSLDTKAKRVSEQPSSPFDLIHESPYRGVAHRDFSSIALSDLPPSLDELRAQSGRPNDMTFVKHINPYGPAEYKLWFAQWAHPSEADKVWSSMLDRFRGLACPGSVAVDIGAHGGDTGLALAAAVGSDGLVLAFEPGPPYQILEINTWINQRYRIHAYNFAIDKTDGEWCYQSGCNGCNGGKIACGKSKNEIRLVAHRLVDVLKTNYDPVVTDKISFIKIDTEGFDADVVLSLSSLPVRPVIQVEWFAGFRKKQCSEGTKKMFEAAHFLDYDIYAWSESRFSVIVSCRDLPPSSRIQDFVLFPKDKPPLDPITSGGRMFQHCPIASSP